MLSVETRITLPPEAKDTLNKYFDDSRLYAPKMMMFRMRQELVQKEGLLKQWQTPRDDWDYLGRFFDGKLGRTPLRLQIEQLKTTDIPEADAYFHEMARSCAFLYKDIRDGRIDRVENVISEDARHGLQHIRKKDDWMDPDDSSRESERRRGYWAAGDAIIAMRVINPEKAEELNREFLKLEKEYMKNDWGYK